MDRKSTSGIALMSIHPEFATRILNGEKRVEFRRRSAARELTHLIIYATTPVKAVVGVAEVDRMELASPETLWKNYGDVGGIGRSAFFRYFEGVTEGVAYVIRKVWTCSMRVPLGRKGLPKRAPQAFQYVSSLTASRLLTAVE